MEYETLCLPADGQSLRMAADLFRQGELVAFPTETVYGLGANALNEAAVRRIFDAKNRPADNPLIVHVARAEQLDELCEVNGNAKKLMAAYWPGPLTLLLPRKSAVPDVVTAGLASVGVRMPSHPVAHEMLKICGLPIAAPSANRSTRPSPTTAQHVMEDMKGRIPLILDGGACDVGVESTVLDLTHETPVVLRPGAVTPAMIAKVCGSVSVADSVMRPLKEGETAPSPGMRHKHYAPMGKMTILRGDEQRVIEAVKKAYDASENACILAMTQHTAAYGDRRVMDMGANDAEIAHNIFALLRQADALHIDRLFAEGVNSTDVGLAVMNRMARAAAFDIIEE